MFRKPRSVKYETTSIGILCHILRVDVSTNEIEMRFGVEREF